jgi:F0F1-type ATP synthase epsilon subunit
VADETLRLLVRTPQGDVFDGRVTSLRVPTDTGQVGLRPRSEEAALVVEPGLALAASADGLRFVATAGGLLRCDGKEALLLTPLAVVGESAQAVRAELEETLRIPRTDLELRAVLQRLETGILHELRGSTSAADRGGALD